jgi:2-methylaconitate cis-trans-isomerase PrpF
MPLHSLRAVFMRGGTSKALMFRRDDLPARQQDWAPIFLAAMGTPDSNGRQLDGMGGGTSSLSKVCVIGAPTRSDADVDYTFAQIGVETATVDYGGNCGNMSSAVGPFAVEEGLVKPPADGPVSVRIHNTNTGKLIIARFAVEGGRATVRGPLAIDGVTGSGAPIRLEFRDLAGARTGRLLPTGQPLQKLSLADGRAVRASLVDAANPCVFVAAADLGMQGSELPTDIEANARLMADLDALRRLASIAMGLTADLAAAGASRSVPFIGMVAPPRAWRTLSGDERPADQADIAVRMLSSGNAHRAIPITSALCVAVACRTPGTLPAELCAATRGALRIGHASGTTLVEADADAATGRVLHASVYRTARRLFQGEVLYPGPAGDQP